MELVVEKSERLRLFTRKVQVTHSNLWARLTSEVQKEDTVSVTVKTTWPDNGGYYNCLAGFAPLETSAVASELDGAIA